MAVPPLVHHQARPELARGVSQKVNGWIWLVSPGDPIAVAVAVGKILDGLGILHWRTVVVPVRVFSESVGSGLPTAVRWRCADP